MYAIRSYYAVLAAALGFKNKPLVAVNAADEAILAVLLDFAARRNANV